ncbi:MAG: lamin tail domain-containing protein, partial [Verrucomicrobiota bacterium]
ADPYSLSYGLQFTAMRDVFCRDLWAAAGFASTRSRYYHLLLNGQYWGLYNTCERPEASYGETYFGGKKEDYDVIKVEAGPYTINATDGNMTAWTKLYNLVKAGITNDAAYQRIQGNNPDGTRNPAYDNLVDVPNLIDYMLVILHGGNLDAPISNFLGNNSPNNWYGLRDRVGPDGFRFFVHDAEHTLLNVNEDRTGPYPAGNSSVLQSNPQWIWQKLQANAEFRTLVADHVHRHFFNGGALTPSACTARFMTRKNEIDRAVVGESARWGDAKRATPFTRDLEWVSAINNIVNNFFPRRSDIVLDQLKVDGLYPSVVAPLFNQHGGNVDKGFQLTMTALAGTIFFTRDGTDPRLRGGAVSPGALAYSSPVGLDESVNVKSRVLSGTNWSALNEAGFTIIQSFTELLITEIMYNPPSFGGANGDDLEFIELKNVAPVELDLSGIQFTNGVRYAFPDGTKLGTGRFILLASNPVAFTNKYPGLQVFAPYQGHLSDGGETLTLVHAAGKPIVSLSYGDQTPWPPAADGGGFSLVPVNPNINSDPNNSVNWRASTRAGGSPGADDPPSNIPVVWINEVLTHTDPPQVDAIELHNPGLSPAANLGNWYLTDDRSVPQKFRIPSGTTIPAGGFVVFTERDFNPNPGIAPSFTLNSHGEEVYLYSADAAGNLTGYSDGFSFGAAANGVTFGRYTTSTGEIQYPPQVQNTLSATNSGPRVGPVVINEIRYHPAPGDEEFIELKNITSSPVKLYDVAIATNTWKLDGVDFIFPPATEIPANGLLLVVGSDPASFRTRNNVPLGIPVFGPYSGVLQDGGETLRLERPETQETDSNGVVFVPYVAVDEVRYNDRAPWPTNAAGFGSSIERITPSAYGNDPVNWRASPGSASPGYENSGNRVPRVDAGLDQTFQSDSFPITANLTGTANDDGQPNPPGVLSITWSAVNGPGAVLLASPNQLNTIASFPGVGSYVLRLMASDGALSASDDVTITIERTPSQVTVIPTGSIWKYLDQGIDQGTDWQSRAFDDSSWAGGKAQLGYGDGDEATVVSFGPDSARKFITTYFRQSFRVKNAAAVTQLSVRLLRDDGAIVYLNGVEVFRSNMPEGEITFDTFASEVVGGADETSTFFDKNIDPTLLVEGTNVIAVEIHQQNSTSTDISFDLELSGLTEPANQAPKVSAGNDQIVTIPASITLNGSAVDDGLPIPPGKLDVAWSKVGGPGNVSFGNVNAAVTTAGFVTPGVYVLALTATDGTLAVSDEMSVTVTGGGQTNLQFDSIELIRGFPYAVLFRFTTEAGKSYTVQQRDSLSNGTWLKLKDIAALPGNQPVDITESVPIGRASRFYRIVTPQQP